MKPKKILDLFLTFFKIGLFTFGGGYAMIALIENYCVSKKNWIEHDEFLDVVAIAESTPGPISINSATYIGYKVAGVLGSAAATLGVVLPSFIIIFIISLFFDAFLSLKFVANAFRGIQVAVVYLIFSAGIKMFRGIKRTPFNMTILCATIVAMLAVTVFALNFSTIFMILISGVIGIAAYLISKLTGKDKKNDTV